MESEYSELKSAVTVDTEFMYGQTKQKRQKGQKQLSVESIHFNQRKQAVWLTYGSDPYHAFLT